MELVVGGGEPKYILTPPMNLVLLSTPEQYVCDHKVYTGPHIHTSSTVVSLCEPAMIHAEPLLIQLNEPLHYMYFTPMEPDTNPLTIK